VTRRLIAKKQLCKQATVQQPLLGNSSVETFFTPAPRENAIMEETFSVWFVPELYNGDYREAGSGGRGQFENLEEGECPPLEAVTKQRLVTTEKTLCVLQLQ
jgi:hypothetical protein